ncbi:MULTISPECIES: DUF6163 family protein [Azorhizobium]|jgi:hypothetical protein|uniref:Transmembrane protein n=1 Tax=Azorhizobium caulinodans (strain ATCC 43989 / DSM 5975 / JCM 20966 / LMG 6465 / NBRC 14845 / NCIMB 13405 / ORS 571) TaxID=438753 RepID=A8HXV9_AZOC5|nr:MULTISPECIES: DUF6163 family protein [Azorhizobium]TDT94492.1 hypothetical protein DFO45_2241 [Azorhizobium sp. AG788]BAF87543.1 hypothetical protein AZC_1545 [Azorhizobium caulinodans ORS 571]
MSHYDPIDASARARMERLTPWRRRLVFFLRAVAFFLLLEGIYHWAMICGVGDGRETRFESLPMAAQGVVIWSAIIDPIAGVGLWLGAGWAVVLWLLATASQVVVGAWAPDGMSRLLVFTLFEVALVIAYAVLSIRAARESDQD